MELAVREAGLQEARFPLRGPAEVGQTAEREHAENRRAGQGRRHYLIAHLK